MYVKIVLDLHAKILYLVQQGGSVGKCDCHQPGSPHGGKNPRLPVVLWPPRMSCGLHSPRHTHVQKRNRKVTKIKTKRSFFACFFFSVLFLAFFSFGDKALPDNIGWSWPWNGAASASECAPPCWPWSLLCLPSNYCAVFLFHKNGLLCVMRKKKTEHSLNIRKDKIMNWASYHFQGVRRAIWSPSCHDGWSSLSMSDIRTVLYDVILIKCLCGTADPTLNPSQTQLNSILGADLCHRYHHATQWNLQTSVSGNLVRSAQLQRQWLPASQVGIRAWSL